MLVTYHYNDVIMSAMASQITSLTIVYSTTYSKHRSKKTSKLCITGLWVGNSPVTGEFPTQKASDTENVSMWWHHHVYLGPKLGHHCACRCPGWLCKGQKVAHHWPCRYGVRTSAGSVMTIFGDPYKHQRDIWYTPSKCWVCNTKTHVDDDYNMCILL